MKMNKLQIVFFSVAGVTLLFFSVFYLSTAWTINKLKLELTGKIAQKDQAHEQIKAAGVLVNTVKAAQGQLQLCRKRMQDCSARLDVLQSFETLSSRSGTTEMNSLKMLDAQKIMDGEVDKQLYELVFKGTYHDIANFLYKLTHMDTLITLEKMVLSPDVEGKLRAKVVAACYFTNPENEGANGTE